LLKEKLNKQWNPIESVHSNRSLIEDDEEPNQPKIIERKPLVTSTNREWNLNGMASQSSQSREKYESKISHKRQLSTT